jgi:hypothetical protein
MKSKLFEIRDEATFIPAIAVEMTSDDPAEAWLLARAGYSINRKSERLILFTRLEGGEKSKYDPYGGWREIQV